MEVALRPEGNHLHSHLHSKDAVEGGGGLGDVAIHPDLLLPIDAEQVGVE